MNICLRENLNQVDLLSPSVNKITQQEYYAKQRGQINLDKLNAELITEGLITMIASGLYSITNLITASTAEVSKKFFLLS